MDDSYDPTFLTADVDVDFDFLRAQTQHQDDTNDCWERQAEEITDPSDFPTATDWKDDAPDVISNTVVTCDKGRIHIWKQGKTEIGIIRTAFGEDHPSFGTLATRIFGSKSKLFQLLESELSLSYEKYCRFLATFFAASSRSSPAARLLEDDRFDSTGMMERGEYHRVIKQIEEHRSGDESLWMQIEELFNSLAKKHFLSERGDEELYIALDDDKHHFNYSKHADTYGLQRARHIKTNRMGHIAHTAGLSATGMPLCVMFQREEETQSQVYERMCKRMFGGRTGNGNPSLQGITFGSDRGYWTPTLLFVFLLKCGADVIGTVARCFWYPFTFTKGKVTAIPEVDTHNRIEIRMKGAKDVFYKTLKWGTAKIRATCYRTGTGTAVSLAMSTLHHGPLFDLNLSFPKDHKWYFNPTVLQDERNAKAFPVVAGSDHYDIIKSLPIQPLTLVQGDTVWFIMRQFSLTSSTVDKCISSRCREITQDHALRDSYETVLHAVDRMNLLPRISDYNDARRNNNNNNNTTNRRARGRTVLDDIIGGDSDSSDDDEEESPAMDWPANWIRRVNDGEDGLFRDRLNSDNMDEAVIRGIIDKHDNGKSTSSISILKKKLIEWSELSSYRHRKYFFYNVQQLKDRILELDGQAAVTGKNKIALFDLVVRCDRKRVGRNTTLNNNQDPYDDDEDDEDTVDPVLLDIFKASKMKPLKEEAKAYCRQGHLLELPFLKQFHQHSMEGLTCGYKSIAIHETPVVESTSITGALDSSDAELIYKKEDHAVNDSGSDTDDDDDDIAIETMPIEIKARVAHSTFYSERQLIEANLGLAAFESGEPWYVEIDAEGGELHKWIPKHKESFQLLHHVAVRDSRKGLFLVGNKTKLMFGVFVTYSDNLIASYRALLKDLFDRALKPFYDDNIQLPQAKIEKILQAKEMKKLNMTYHSFQTDFYIWRQLRIKKALQLPIPPCNRILPYNHSVWNNLKGASDTATKLMWNCQIKFASSGRSQVVASAKFLQLYSILLHREYQVSTAKTNLNVYASLYHFRNSRNKNYPFHKTVDTLSIWFIKQADDAVAAAAAAVPPTPPTTALTIDTTGSNGPLVQTPPRVQRNNRSSFQEIRNYTTVTGGTPCTGRARDPLNKTAEWEADQDRLKNCNGTLYKDTKKRSKCCICGGNTNHVCIGCKRPYCMVNRDEKICSMILGGDSRVAFLDGERPPSELVMNGVAADGSTKEFCTVENGCFHMYHRQSISQRVNSLPSPALVSPVAVEE
ncbi:hypothetical protein FRACYDRAFT_232182 [Fragilariopsis cylindrus CCMP1102]|uniref:PiggyBac transposable element-derived protein domain-containing protein n=1 Tax=Fragilariopsis cylindrus CCMP1102 TaxID=635003 RepID=A0A1E7FV44_9STRA|nr:hypothetical protein FRACYDRAFT_232182 [Fragilariopsis cylindrus CCMP1102]|eukprot:OEU22028.1 hypothetical protein FRACYDRAFT_232182 [Fragilariopsis cylindrus CCMP1102]